MPQQNADEILKIFNACCATLYAVLKDIPAKQLAWAPSPDSRSISGITRHLIRVDNWFLKRQGFEPQGDDPGLQADGKGLLAALQTVHQQIRDILNNATREDLLRRSQAEDAKDFETLVGVILHISQHYLYHLAQMIYLRRACDRHWESPLGQWEAATHAIADRLAVMEGLEHDN